MTNSDEVQTLTRYINFFKAELTHLDNSTGSRLTVEKEFFRELLLAMIEASGQMLDVLTKRPDAAGMAHQPRRDNDVEAWIKAWRDKFRPHSTGADEPWFVLDDMLDEYRLHADTGTPLDAEV